MDKSVKILIADDSEFMRNILMDILKEDGFSNFFEASNGQECLDLIEKESPDLILLDMIMPEVDGMEVLKQNNGKIKVVVISAVGQDEMIDEAKNNGALGYIVKPFDNKQVIEVINQVFS